MRATLAALTVACALGAPAGAEIFKCVGPSGDVRFTSDPSQCPNAAPHAPKRDAVQRVADAQPTLASARPGARTRLRSPAAVSRDPSGALEATWRQKKADAERNLRMLEAAHERILTAVRWCNKGHGVTTESSRTGLRQQVSCSEIDADRTKIEGELERARDYLATGLEEECRQAGCLPGWLR